MSIDKVDTFKKWKFINARPRRNNPEALVSQSKIDDADEDLKDFFLTLALMFNDLRGILIINQTLKGVYEKPAVFEEADKGHMGDYGGIDLQVLKTIHGLLYEALAYLKKKQDIISSNYVKNLIRVMPSRERDDWELLMMIATDQPIINTKFKNKYNDIIRILKILRNHVSFHYQAEDGRKRLIDGFRRFFFEGLEGVETGAREFAYRSTKDSDIEASRYYYADAALQGYFINLFGGDDQAKRANDSILEIHVMVMHALNRLLIEYHKHKRDA